MASLTASNLVQVGISMVLQDQVSPKTGQISDSFRKMYNDIRNAAMATKDAYDIPLQILRRGISGSIDAYKTYAEVGKDVFMTAAMSGNPLEDLDERLDHQKELLESAKNLNLEVPLTTGDIASAQRFMAMAGMSRDMILATQAPISKLASIFSMSAGGKGGVADIMTNIMATFQLGAGQVEEVANDLFIATTRSNMNLRDLGDAIKYSGAEMMTAGISLREGAAAIGLLGDMGIQGSSAGTAIANTLRYLKLSISGQKTKGAAALKALGLSREDFLDAQGNLLGLHHMYTTVARAIQRTGMTNDQIGTAFYNIFGVRGSRNMLPVIQQLANGTDKMSIVMREMETHGGLLNETMEKYMKTNQGQIDLWNSTMDALKISAGQAMGDLITPLLRVANVIMGIMASVSNTGFGRFLIKGMFVMAFTMALALVRRMAITFNSIYVTLVNSGTAIKTAGTSFMSDMKIAATYMAYMASLSQTMAKNSMVTLGTYNSAPVTMQKTKSGAMILSWMGANGKQMSTKDPNVMTKTVLAMAGASDTKGSPKKSPPVTKGPIPIYPFKGANKGIMKALGLSNVLKVAGKGIGKAVGMAIPGLNALMWIWLLVDLGKMAVDAIKGNTKANKDRQAQEEEKMKREAEKEARENALRSMSWEEYIKTNNEYLYGVMSGMLGPDGKPIGKVHILVNGQEIGKMVSDQVLDTTEYIFEGMNNGLQSNLANQGF